MPTGPVRSAAEAPTVSVALCSRNGSRFVEAQLRSILAQTLRPGEIVLSDDASSDGTVRLARAIVAESSPPMILTVFENSAPLGVTANFEQAVKACSGELIALCDQDDVWHPDRLEKAATLFDADAGLLLAFGDARLIDDEGNDLGRSLFDRLEVSSSERSMVAGGEGFRVLIKRNLATGATVMFRRRLLDQALPFPPEWVHDEWLAIIAASFGGIELMQESLVDYRQHSSNVIGVRAPTFWYKFTRVIEAQGNRNARLAERARALVRRLEEFEGVVEPHDLDLAVGKARAEAFRAALPSSRLLRIVPILRAASRGWYVSFTSQGRKDMVRDLVQPHRDAPQRAAG